MKTHTVTLRLTAPQFRWLENAAQFIENETGCKVTRASVMLRLMEKGLPHFEEELAQLRARNNALKKRHPNLQLVFSRPEKAINAN